ASDAAMVGPSAPGASFRPGMMAARSEQLGSTVDARISAAWGTPATSSPLPSRAESMDVIAPPARAPETTRAVTGPARMAQFLESLVGVQAVRATAPLPVVDSTATATASAGE